MQFKVAATPRRRKFPRRPRRVHVDAALFCGALLAALLPPQASAAPLPARVTRILNDVKLQTPPAAPRAAALNEPLQTGASLRTGAKSRAELTFADRSVARLGANTACTLAGKTRSVVLGDGVVLFQAPRGSGPRIKTATITAAIGGSTGIIERYADAYIKILLLEGTARVYMDRVGESVLVQAGQLLITKPDAKTLPEAVHFDIGQLYKTSLLTNPDFAPLASAGKISREIEKQKNDPDFIRTNLVIFGRGTLVNLIEPVPQEPREKAAAARAASKPRSR